MSLATNVIRRKGRYSFRARVPADLVAKMGRIELIRSLKTSNPTTARERAYRFGLRVNNLWDAVRQMPTLTRAEIDDLVRRYFHDHLEQDRHWRIGDKPDFEWRSVKDVADALTLVSTEEEVDVAVTESGKHIRDFLQDHLTRITHACMKHALATNDWREAEIFVKKLVESYRVEVPRDSAEYRLLSQGVLRAVFEATRIILERSNGNWAAEPIDPLFKTPAPMAMPMTSTSGSPGEKPRTESLSSFLERFLIEKKGIAEKTVLDYRAAVRTLEEVLGKETGIDTITRQQAASFKDALLRTPSNWTKRFPGQTLPAVIELNEKRGLPVLNAATINGKYLSPLSTFFRWAVANGLVDKNPFEGLRVQLPKGHKKTKKRLPFNTEQIIQIFTAPLFVGCQSDSNITQPGSHLVRDHRYWAPLIALWTGARANEIGQLECNDLRRTDGSLCFHFTTEAEAEQKRLKTEAARRTVPVHPELERLGFMAYLTVRGAKGDQRLFPSWGKGNDGYYSSVFSKWFGRFLTSVDLTDRRLVFHSFRHAFKDALRRAMVEERIQDTIMGHESQHVSAEYGLGYTPSVLYDAIRRVRYDGVDLSHLHSKS